MDRLVLQALEKLQRREHFVRVLHYQLVTRRITQDEYQRRLEEIENRHRLTAEERRAYEKYTRQQAKGR